MTKPYFSLCIRENGRWSPQFGDFDRKVVAQEYFDSYAEIYPARGATIIATEQTQAAILAGVKSLNALGARPSRIRRPQ